MPKRPCTDRAKWRLLRGKPAQPLAAHYRLDCDFGTPVLTIYREGEGDTPTYLCEVHAAAERDATAIARPKPIGEDSFVEVDQRANPVVSVRLDRADSVGDLPVPQLAEHPAQRPIQHDDPIPSPEAVVVKRTPRARKPTAQAPKSNEPGTIAPSNPTTQAPTPIVSTSKADALSQTPTAVISNPNVSVATSNAPAPTETVHRSTPLAKKTSLAKVNSLSRGPVRDLTYGNPAKALVDETIWNLQQGDHEAYRTALRQGKPATEAAQAAGGQLAVVYRKIQEYAVRIDALLSASNTAISADAAIHTVLDSETLKVIGDDAMTDEQKDAAVARLGEFQEWINGRLDRPTTPLKAHQAALAVADRANWGAQSHSIPNELKAAHRVVYSSLRDAIHAAVPDVRDASERLANLYAAKSDLETLLHAEIPTPEHLGIAAPAATASPEQKFAEA